MTTVFFVFAKECGACAYFKESFYNDVSALFQRLGIEIKEFTAEDFSGIAPGTTDYPFIEDIKFFPCIFLIKTEVLEAIAAGTFTEDVFERVFIWNGLALPKGNEPRIRTIQPQVYGAKISDFERFYKDFLKSSCSAPLRLNRGPQLAVTSSKNETQFESSHRTTRTSVTASETTTGARRMYVCRGIRGVPIGEKY